MFIMKKTLKKIREIFHRDVITGIDMLQNELRDSFWLLNEKLDKRELVASAPPPMRIN
jgi:hypothetical protein